MGLQVRPFAGAALAAILLAGCHDTSLGPAPAGDLVVAVGGEGAVVGTVTNRGQVPLAGAVVWVRPRGAPSPEGNDGAAIIGDSGGFAFGRLVTGPHELFVAYIGYAKCVADLEVRAGVVDTLRLQLDTASLVLDGPQPKERPRGYCVEHDPPHDASRRHPAVPPSPNGPL